MEKISNAVYGVVCLVVIVILVATICIPVIEDAQSEQITVGQNTTQLYTVADDSSTIEITIADNVITVNDYVLPEATNRLVALCSEFYIQNNWLVYEGGFVQIKSATITEGTVSYVMLDDSEDSMTYDSTVMYPDPKGDYGEFAAGTTFYTNEDSRLYAVADAVTAVNPDATPSAVNVWLSIAGTIENMDTVSALGSTTGLVTFEAKYTAENDCYKVTVGYDEITYTDSNQVTYVSNAGGTVYYYAPIEYTYLSTTDNMVIQLLSILPILLLIIPVMLAANMITRRD